MALAEDLHDEGTVAPGSAVDHQVVEDAIEMKQALAACREWYAPDDAPVAVVLGLGKAGEALDDGPGDSCGRCRDSHLPRTPSLNSLGPWASSNCRGTRGLYLGLSF